MLRELERILQSNDEPGFSALLLPGAAARTTSEFLEEWVEPGVTRAIIQERMRVANTNLPAGQGYDVFADVLSESGRKGRVGTWQIKVQRDLTAAPGREWRIAELAILTTVRGLYRLSLNTEKEFTVTNFALNAEDFQLRLPLGTAFVAETDAGVTGMVLLGRGEMTFSPSPPSERGQVRIYSGEETLQSRFSWLYIRAKPDEFDSHFDPGALQPRAVDPRDLRRADEVFQENLALSFGIDLGDLSRDKWSVAPKSGDLIAEMQADRSHLTYLRTVTDPEDIRFFDRTRERTIAMYTSKEKLAERGPFFTEDDQTDYDIVHYDIEASFDPRREWIEGKTTLLLTPSHGAISTVVLKLAEPLTIRSVVSRKLGYLMALRVTGQEDVIINLPKPLLSNTLLDLEFTYGGRLPAVPPEREALDLQPNEYPTMPSQPSYIYTGRSGWYPHGQVTDYATASLTLRVPDSFSAVASGALDEGSPTIIPSDPRGSFLKEYRFSATQPSRYFGWAISKFVSGDKASVSITPTVNGTAPAFEGASYLESDVAVESSGLMQRRARDLSEEAQTIMKFYGTIAGDIPYQAFTLAIVERNTPGGHSPPYFAALNQPPPATPVIWRSDPAFFDGFPEFFLAHESAHQWWGQAVGWKNYHEQWISEGFSQYFAALYAEQLGRGDVFRNVVSQMARWTLDRSDQGPVYLGYRLGHIKNDGRVFRALVYNKGALSLHMLRRLLGDEVFFRGLRRFYATWRFKKAGTEDVRAAFEAEAGRPLDRFFQRWIYGSTLPRMRFTYTTEADAVTVRFEQIGEVFDVPVTVTVQYAGSSVDIMVPVTEQVTTQRIPLTGSLRGVEADRDNAAPVIFVR